MTGERQADLVLAGGTVVTGAGLVLADVAVRDGRVAALLPPGDPTGAAAVLDVRGRCLLPGLIDSHVHFRQPGLAHKEDWAHGSRAAVAGGITTVVDMPNTRPPLTTPEDAWAKHRTIAGTSLVDYRFHAGVNPTDPGLVAAFGPREATSVKVFLSGHHTAPDVLREPADLDRLCATLADCDLTMVCHAEHDGVLDLFAPWREGWPTAVAYERQWPRTAAIVAVAGLIQRARRYGTRIHVLHVSSREEVDLLSAAMASGVPISFEVTGHHLTFTDADMEQRGSLVRLRPAIREAVDRDALWAAVLDGTVATIGSDHAPHTLAEKGLTTAPPPGLPGVEELLPAVYTGLTRRSGGASAETVLPTVARLLAEQPARICRLAHRKGAIAPGLDADIVVFDPRRPRRFVRGEVHAKCGWSAYEGLDLVGGIDLVLRRGRVVYRWSPDGVAFGEPDGDWLEPAPVLPSGPAGSDGPDGDARSPA